MPAFHSQIDGESAKIIASFPILSLRVTTKMGGRGVAPICSESFDIVDESLDLFKANIFFSSYQPEGSGVTKLKNKPQFWQLWPKMQKKRKKNSTQKFRENNFFINKSYCKLISRKIFKW